VFPTLVFVHLGPAPSKQLWKNLDRVSSIWPNLDLWVILDDPKNLFVAHKLGLNVFEYKKSALQMKNHNLKKEFRRGFWHFSRLRLDALFEFHASHPEKKLLHIESDILLLRNFPFEYFNDIKNITWMNVPGAGDSAAVIYLPSNTDSIWLKEQLKIEVSKDSEITDMQALWNIRSRFDTNIDLLPTLGSGLPVLGGVFDSAALGMWLTGEDPQNSFGITHRYINRFNIEQLSGSNSPFLFSENQLIISGEPPLYVFNLHVHSKNLKLLSRKAEVYLLKFVSSSVNFSSQNIFNPRILLSVIFEYGQRGKILSLIAAIPIVNKIRKSSNLNK
jgi:hypothetical protein